jgi:hypothetical protein
LNRLNGLLFLVLSLAAFACPPAWTQEAPQQGGNGAEEKPGGGNVNSHPLVFLADGVLPPMSFALEGRHVGIIVDIAEAVFIDCQK